MDSHTGLYGIRLFQTNPRVKTTYDPGQSGLNSEVMLILLQQYL